MVASDSIDGPANLKQIRNKKYRMTKQSNTGSGSNVADQVLTTIGMLTSHETVQKIIHCKNKIPCIILYSKDQNRRFEIKLHLSDNGSVLGLDRTFSVGPCFVTPTTYKNKGVVHRETKEHLLMLGPNYLHWDGDFETYHAFVAHLKGELQSDNITLGSDDEKGLTKALRLGFPMATHLLCTLHLKDNIRAYMSDKVGCSVKERTQILRLIFGSDGLCSSDDTATFEIRLDGLQGYFERYPRFALYFGKHMAEKLRRYVIEPMKQGVVTKLWTNNNAESMNHRLKQQMNWTPQKLPELVKKISDISRGQMADVRRAW